MDETSPFDAQSLLVESETLDAFLAELAAEARRRMPGANGCGVTLERDGRPYTVASAAAPPRRSTRCSTPSTTAPAWRRCATTRRCTSRTWRRRRGGCPTRRSPSTAAPAPPSPSR
ncbi:hypothetical protein ACFQVA_34185 [Actinomadura keratinilytica]